MFFFIKIAFTVYRIGGSGDFGYIYGTTALNKNGFTE